MRVTLVDAGTKACLLDLLDEALDADWTLRRHSSFLHTFDCDVVGHRWRGVGQCSNEVLYVHLLAACSRWAGILDTNDSITYLLNNHKVASMALLTR